jgi:hypothetical protein
LGGAAESERFTTEGTGNFGVEAAAVAAACRTSGARVVAFCFPALTGRANLCRASGAGAAQVDRVVGWFGLRGWLGANYNRALGFVAFSTYFAVNL